METLEAKVHGSPIPELAELTQEAEAILEVDTQIREVALVPGVATKVTLAVEAVDIQEATEAILGREAVEAADTQVPVAVAEVATLDPEVEEAVEALDLDQEPRQLKQLLP